jgi:hypothetical protein
VTAAPSVAAPVHALLTRAIDYAGLFPPAELEPAAAVANYLAYRESSDSWALGRLVVPAGRLEQLVPFLPTPVQAPVPLSVVLGPDLETDLARVREFERKRHGTIAAVELKERPAVKPNFPNRWTRYVEVSLDDPELDRCLESIAALPGFGKIRTGGTTAGAFPAPEKLTRFLLLAARRRLPFKATAGLHHPIRGSYRLTYQEGAPSGPMYGYLNLSVAAALAWTGAGRAEIEAALLESDGEQLRFDSEALVWRSRRFEAQDLTDLRKNFLHGFGSCSFREPLDELVTLVPAR